MRISDWSSDVCSSDLGKNEIPAGSGNEPLRCERRRWQNICETHGTLPHGPKKSAGLLSAGLSSNSRSCSFVRQMGQPSHCPTVAPTDLLSSRRESLSEMPLNALIMGCGSGRMASSAERRVGKDVVGVVRFLVVVAY